MKYILIATLFSFVTGSYATVSCDFEQDMCGWSQNSSDVYIWTRQTNISGTGFSIPNAYEGLYYACISSNNYKHGSDYGRLSSPVVSISSITNFTFYYYNYGMYGNLSLYRKENGLLNLIWSHHTESPLEGNYWASASLLIPPANKTQFIFEGHFTSAKTYYLGLDSIVLESEKTETTTPKIYTTPSNQTTKFSTKETTSVPTSKSSTTNLTTTLITTLKSSSQTPKTTSPTTPGTSSEISSQTPKTNYTASQKTSPEISSQTPKTNFTTSPEISSQPPTNPPTSQKTTPPTSQKTTPEFSSQGPQTNLTSSPEMTSKIYSPTSKLTTLSPPSTTPGGISPLQSSTSLTLLTFLLTLVSTLIIL